ncbi:type II toxin-antitoxin system VapC family toxin [Candidatus Nanohalobium constans]|uniref:PilT protein domain protein n=1 Tax=Candidatus Nanohalobium constans TaxID=2565781 RepID=A0A5Q0UHH6_9ARCH|nr:PIN domain-containing protein [Candidatus Nanohalobium constans]QGA80811.1 PilT protein domain protein [Candidatus Nanohalobium constans]
MDRYFLDTSFLIAFFDSGDEHHEKSRELMKEIKSEELVISDQIFSETVNTAFSKVGYKTARDCSRYLRKSQIKIMYLNEPGFQKACKLFRENEISFTDCSIISAMNLLGIEKLATFDNDFEKFQKTEIIPE